MNITDAAGWQPELPNLFGYTESRGGIELLLSLGFLRHPAISGTLAAWFFYEKQNAYGMRHRKLSYWSV